MTNRRFKTFSGKTLLAACFLAGMQLVAPATGSEGYSVEDLQLPTARELVDVCTINATHEHYETALAFCYGFFEGAVRYHEAIALTPDHTRIVCDPPDVTREQAVSVFTDYIQANPQYGKEAPIDAIFRAMVDKWPCAD